MVHDFKSIIQDKMLIFNFRINMWKSNEGTDVTCFVIPNNEFMMGIKLF